MENYVIQKALEAIEALCLDDSLLKVGGPGTTHSIRESSVGAPCVMTVFATTHGPSKMKSLLLYHRRA
jgi:hypothetical protein